MRKPAGILRVALAAAAVSCACITNASAVSLGVGQVEADALRLRDSASTEGDILATASKGEAVVVLEDAGDNWYKVDYQSVEGYMSGEYLSVFETADITIGYGMVDADGAALNVRSGPGTDFSKVTTLSAGTVVEIVGIDNGWYKITYDGATGYVSSDYLSTTKDSTGSRSDDTVTVSNSGMGTQIAAYAMKFLGVPYVYGGNGPSSFDCSGFTKYVYSNFGYTLNRTATGQLSNGISVSKDQLQTGDLVFFKANTSKPVSHVGIYIGNGQFIHASTNQYQVQIDNLFSGYYANVYVYGRHVL